MINTIARLGIMGFLVVVVVLAVVGLAAYGFVERPDHDLTSQLIVVLAVGAGSVLAAAGTFFKGRGDSVNLENFVTPAPTVFPLEMELEEEPEPEPPSSPEEVQ